MCVYTFTAGTKVFIQLKGLSVLLFFSLKYVCIIKRIQVVIFCSNDQKYGGNYC